MASFVAQPGPCEILPDQISQMEYDFRDDISPEEYRRKLDHGWRRFGMTFFRPVCAACAACQQLRVVASELQPSRSQRRIWRRGSRELTLHVVEPTLSAEHLDLFHRFHVARSLKKGWTQNEPIAPLDYADSFIVHPFPTEEWQYLLGDRLVGVGYVDVLNDGLSAIYFYYDPEEERRSLGVFNILSLVERARERRLPYVYLGYYVPSSRSMSYKALYRPCEVARAGIWQRLR